MPLLRTFAVGTATLALSLAGAGAAGGAGGPVGDAFPDFDGDGHGDLAVSAPGEDLGGAIDAGVVHVLYGTGSGTSATRNQFLDAGSSGGAVTGSEKLGQALAYGDFNGDGRDDLAIGAPLHDAPGAQDSGRVYVLYGRSSSSSPLANAEIFDQNLTGVPDASETQDGFGAALTAGDFDGDGRDDLVVGVPRESHSSTTKAGSVYVLWGTGAGLTAADDLLLTEASAGVAGDPGASGHFGEGLATGDVDGDGRDDLLIGTPNKHVGAATGAGAIHVLFGSAAGFDLARDRLLDQGTAGVPGTPQSGDYLGTAITTGDFDGDGRDDIAIGLPNENPGGLNDAGDVLVLEYRSSAQTPWAGAVWHQDSAGISGTAESHDRFGSAVAAGDFDHDGRDDLAIGIPDKREGFSSDVGAAAVLYGSASGIAAARNRVFSQSTNGILGVGEALDTFGIDLRAFDSNGDGFSDLAVGVPYESSNLARIGAVHVIRGGAAGLSAFSGATVTNRLFVQGSGGVPGVAEADDQLGWLGG